MEEREMCILTVCLCPSSREPPIYREMGMGVGGVAARRCL